MRAIDTEGMPANGSERPMRMLLLWEDSHGGNCTSSAKKLSILEELRRYGRALTLAGVGRTVRPCAFAQQRSAEAIQTAMPERLAA